MSQQLGETAQGFREGLKSRVEDLAEKTYKEKGLDEFWIIVTHKADKYLFGVIREAMGVLAHKPKSMLNSICFHVNWKQGKIDTEWVLPLDFNEEMPDMEGHEHSEFILDSLQDFPVEALV